MIHLESCLILFCFHIMVIASFGKKKAFMDDHNFNYITKMKKTQMHTLQIKGLYSFVSTSRKKGTSNIKI